MSEVMDYRTGPDLPSYMTLEELRLLHVCIERMAIEVVEDPDALVHGFGHENPYVGIHVRDRGPGVRPYVKAPWIEFSIGEKQYAIWRNTGDLYSVGEDGAVADDPIIRND
jgi:hypothetical protein